MKISLFKNKTEVNKAYTQNAITVLESFKVDKYNIQQNRIKEKDEFNKFKVDLPIACFGGLFSKRSKSHLIKSSGLMVLDFDDVESISVKKNELKSLPYILSVFLSPSGRGLKAIVRIPEVKTDEEYKTYYKGLESKIKGLDESGKDISRACFLSYDPNIYINENAKVFNEPIKEEKRVISKKQLKKNDYQIAARVLRIIQYAQIGERHNKILNASRLMGGYVEAGVMTYDESVRLLEQEAYNIDPEDFQTNKKAVYDGLEDGMKNPLPKESINSELKKEESEIKYGKIYYTLSDVDDKIEKLWSEGRQRGYEIGFQDNKITIKLGCTTYVYAAPYAGKTQFWFEVLINLSVLHGLNHVVYSPESGGSEDIYAELIEIYSRSDFFDTYKNRMSEETKKEAKRFIETHFIVLDPDDGILTPEEFYAYVDVIERIYNVTIHTTCADPWNEFKHDFSQDNNRQDMYIERMLGFIRKNAKKTNRHNCIITHVQSQQLVKDNNSDIYYYPLPTYRQIAGGEAWSRKGQQMIAVWRPKRGLCNGHGEPFKPNVSIIEVQKSKPKGIGEIGMIELYYDAKKHCYYEEINGNHIYPSREKNEIKEEKKFLVPEQKNVFENHTLETFENGEYEEAPF